MLSDARGLLLFFSVRFHSISVNGSAFNFRFPHRIEDSSSLTNFSLELYYTHFAFLRSFREANLATMKFVVRYFTDLQLRAARNSFVSTDPCTEFTLNGKLN